MIEKWKIIEDYPDYSISNSGSVKSMCHNKEKILKYGLGKYGYLYVNLYKNGKIKTVKIHRLVLLMFKPIANSQDFQCNHINGIKDDNRLENLEWCTAKENVQHAFKIGLTFGSMLGKKHSTETRKKMSEAQSGEKHVMYGRHHTEEAKRKISKNQPDQRGNKSPNHKLTEKQVIEIKELLKEDTLTQTAIAKMFNVHFNTISMIKLGKRWVCIKGQV